MKKFLAALGSLILLSACDNEIDINAEYKDMTIMYGMLNPVLDTNYVRIQRGYLGDDPASASFGISDSLYYDSTEIDVFIREYNPGATTFNQEVELIWDNSIPLDSGIYTDEGYHLYRIPSNFPIQSSREYEIVVNRADGSVASARTGIVGSINITRPLPIITARYFDGRLQFNVRQNTDGNDPEATEKMIAYQPILYFHYKEYNKTTGSEEFKTETIRLPLEENPFDQIDILFSGNELYSALAARIEEDPSKNILRFFIGMDVEIIGASEELMTFIELSKPSTGVNQNRPQYEQVINGTGIVSSRTLARRNDCRLQQSIYDRLLENGTVCDLNFARVELGGTDTCYCIDNQKVCF
ncbi:hypothetical protein [Croceimicrobium sp.]|uniref:hypothetical protein n=1 Tax=Croceimicrobium sp. TaxID=2828340 RepID=UPI003BAB79DC